MNAVATRIQAILDERGLKLKPVTEGAGVSYYSVYPWWQREHAKPPYEKVKLLADFLEVPVGHLLYGDPVSDQEQTSPEEQLLKRIESLSDDDRNALESYLEHLVAKSNQA